MNETIVIDGYTMTIKKSTSNLWLYLITCESLNLHVNVAFNGSLLGKGKNKYRPLVKNAVAMFEQKMSVDRTVKFRS